MSFGNAIRFDASSKKHGRPEVFWEYGHTSQKKKKNFGYKSKAQPHPLRSKSRHEEEIIPVTMTKTADKPVTNHTFTKDKNLSNRTSDDKKITQPQQAEDGPRKPTTYQRTRDRRFRKGAAEQKGDDKITLTAAQLNTILETIGKLATNREASLRQSVGKLENEASKTPRVEEQPKEADENTGESILNLTENNKTSEKPDTEKPSGTVEVSKTIESPRDPNTATDKENVDNTQQTSYPLPSIQHLSLRDKKRLKWQQEKANAEAGWTPWGRPGGGAPLTDTRGNVLADFNSRKEGDGLPQKQISSPVNSQVNAPQNNIQGSNDYLADQSPGKQATTNRPAHPASVVIRGRTPIQESVDLDTVPGLSSKPDAAAAAAKPSELPPAAIRSSFAIGDAEPDAERFLSAKERERRKWVEELEKQKEEKRLQKLKEKELQKQGESSTWADRMGGYKPKPLPSQGPELPPSGQTGQPDNRVNSAPMNTTVPLPGLSPRIEQHQETYLRGQNAFLDPVTKLEMEEKRRRNQEHMDSIRRQVEEKERLKREAAEKRLREEQIEEARLQAERDLLQRQYETEQQKTRTKEEKETRRVEMLKEAMDKAKEDAEREKHQRRMEHLWKGGHDVQRLHANFEDFKKDPSRSYEVPHSRLAVHTPRGMNATQVISSTRSNKYEEASHVPGLDLTPRDAPHIPHPPSDRPITDAHHSYVENRVLTPSSQRRGYHTQSLSSPQREFGTQTATISRESTGVEYSGPIHEPSPAARTKKVRVKSAAKVRTYSGTVRKAPVPIKERPSWGYQNTRKKKPTKQSEKDPFFEEKQVQNETQKAIRVKKLKQLVDANSAVIPKHRTNKPKSRTTVRNDSESPVPVLQFKAQKKKTSAVPALTQIKNNNNQETDTQSRSKAKSPHRPKSREVRSTSRRSSPPVPAHRQHGKYDDPYDLYAADPGSDTRRSKYSDNGPILAPLKNEDFVPFIRSSNVLNPAHARVPLPISRENTAVERAREAYIQGHKPAHFGTSMKNIEDKGLDILSPSPHKDPIFNPKLLKEHPTNRQEHILQQLGDLKRSLMQKQRELEVGMTTSTIQEPDY